jgi:CBS-domain-containing membrane protein
MTLNNYLNKMCGGGESPTRVGLKEIGWSMLGSFMGIGSCCYLSALYFEPRDMTLIIASFGASAVLIYSAVRSPLAQPRNLIGGHILSAIIGVACYQLLGGSWYSAALAVSCAIAVMLLTGTLHPPGGATALLAVTGSAQIHKLGFLYVLAPVGLGAFIMLGIALAINNLSMSRKYPEYWF